MKKVYSKPVVYCENYKNGKVVSNSLEYAERMNNIITELKENGEICSIGFSEKRGEES